MYAAIHVHYPKYRNTHQVGGPIFSHALLIHSVQPCVQRRSTNPRYAISQYIQLQHKYVCTFPSLYTMWRSAVLAYCVPTAPSLEAIFFIKPLNLPPLPPPSICEPDIEGPRYGCLAPGMGGTGGASAAGGRGRDAKFCDSISVRPASIMAWFFACTAESWGAKRRSTVLLKVPRKASPAP
jgi:hypothetical protein